MPVLSGQPCAVLDALAQFQFDVMKRLNRKFASLQRIAALLEQAGDLTVLVPNLGELIPISSITLDHLHAPGAELPVPGPARDAELTRASTSSGPK
jgi:hypothetical protein